MLLSLPALAYACGGSVAAWHAGLDFEATEQILRTAKIKSVTPIEEHLKKLGRRYKSRADVYYVELEGGIAGIAKPEPHIWSSLAEETGYQICRAAKSKLMAPTVIRHFPELGNRWGSFQYYVESPFNMNKPADSEKALALVSEKDKSDLILMQFMLGRFDIRPENLIIDATGAPLLFDVEEIHFLQHVQYGDFPFIRRLKHLTGIRSRPLPEGTFPFDKVQSLTPQSMGELWLTFKDYVDYNSIRELQRLLNEDYFAESTIRYVIWDKSVWLYRPRKKGSPLFTDVYSRETIENLRALDFEVLRRQISGEFRSRHILGFYNRRDQIIEASTRGRMIP